MAGLLVSVMLLVPINSAYSNFGIKLEKKPINPSNGGNILYVGGSGSGNYTKIQDAVDNSSDGDTVFVYNGTYYDNVILNKSINLKGEDRNTTIIDKNAKGSVIHISADKVNVTGFKIRYSNWPYSGIYIISNYCFISDNIVMSNYHIGIYLYYSNDNVITNNIILDNYYGIILRNSSYNHINNNIITNNNIEGMNIVSSDNNTIKGNSISKNSEYGIWFYDSNRNSIIENTIISNSWSGICLWESCFNTIKDNYISKNNQGGISSNYQSSNNIITKNQIILSNSSGIGFLWSGNTTIINNNISCNLYYGITISDSNNITIINNNISNNKKGINLYYYCSNNSIINNNIFLNKFDGIHLNISSYNLIKNNNISYNNEGNGINLDDSCNNDINCNNISNNTCGMYIHKSKNNTIYHNNLIKNDKNAIDYGNNIWDDGKFGNYWSDYEERYPNARKIWGKGIWDTPYTIEGLSNKDKCPLIKPWPKSKSKDIPNNKASSDSLLLWFLQRFPLLEIILSKMNLKNFNFI